VVGGEGSQKQTPKVSDDEQATNRLLTTNCLRLSGEIGSTYAPTHIF